MEDKLHNMEKKKIKLEERISIPEGVSIEISGDGHLIKASMNGKKTEKNFVLHKVKIKKQGNEIIVSAENTRREDKKIAGAIVAHIKKIFQGLNEDYVYKLEICNVHFPMNVKIEADKLVIKNFLGEKLPRIAKIISGANVEIKGNIIEVVSHDKDAAGLTVSNIELATKIKNRDRRVFQDGIFLTEKPRRR